MKKLSVFFFAAVVSLLLAPKIRAGEPALGIHLLDPNELGQAMELAGGNTQHPGAVTVVLRSDDHDQGKWQAFLSLARANHVMPIIRLATEMTQKGWRRPTKKDIVEHAAFLSNLDWNADPLTIIVFNEPNHGAEWGGSVDPQSYARMLHFTLNWFHTESKAYRVLPAGLDAALSDGPTSMDSFTFLGQVLSESPGLIDDIDGWASHAYPNPGFAASPRERGKRSISGYQDELSFLASHTNRKFDVFITETGWKKTPHNAERIANNYAYAVDRVWNDERIKAITPFVFAALNGPFKQFSFINADGSPTPQYRAWKLLKSGKEHQPSPPLLASMRKWE